MTLKIQVKGIKEFNKYLSGLSRSSKIEMNKLLAISATETQKNAVNSIQTGARTGKTYKRRSITHQASAPGEPPKSDTGALTSNITVEKERGGYTTGSRKGAPWGFWLEFGTSLIKARPWLQPSFDKTVAEINVKIQKLFRGKL